MSDSYKTAYYLTVAVKWCWNIAMLIYLGVTRDQVVLVDYQLLLLGVCFDIYATQSAIASYGLSTIGAVSNFFNASATINLLLQGIAPGETTTPYMLLRVGAWLALLESCSVIWVNIHLRR